MITIYRSNRAEWLAKLLSEQLRIEPPEISETINIIVNSWPTSRWLGDQISIINGINAQTRFPFPGSYLQKIVNEILELKPEQSETINFWKSDCMVWHIINQLPELLKKEEANSLKEWLGKQSSNNGELNIDKWQLAKSIAQAFDDYIFYRPDLIMDWYNPEIKNKELFRNLPPESKWQPILFRLILKSINVDPFSIQVKKAIQLLKQKDIPSKNLPKQLKIFGVSSLAPIQIDFLQALSGSIDIQIYLLTPCQDLWQRCLERRHRLGDDWGNPLNSSLLFTSPKLEAIFGRLGAEFQQLLEGSGDYQLGISRDEELFALPKEMSINRLQKPSILEQLQEKLVLQESSITLERSKTDASLKFIECPGFRRQVQIVRDQIIQLFAKDKTLEPRDILIMTPQVERFAPLISSVFNDINSTNVEIPWRITDRSQENIPGLSKYVLELLDTASQRFTATNLDNLLSNQALQKQQFLNQDEVNELSNHLQNTGFRWGIDSQERNGDNPHSLHWCLERWILGLVFPANKHSVCGNIAPFSAGIDPNKIAKWWELLVTIQNQIREIRIPKTVLKWTELLKKILHESFGDGGEWSTEYISFLHVLENWKQISSNCELKLSCDVVQDILNDELAIESGRFGHRSGSLTISAIEPMRAIPHRVIVLMGLDENQFPRQEIRASFHLLEHRRQLGDPKCSDKDRYVLLEALMSSRENLIITWNSRNEKTGEKLETSNPIQQWLDYLANELNPNDFEGLLIKAPANPLSPNNFLPQPGGSVISCDEIDLKTRKFLDTKKRTKPIALALPLTWSINVNRSPSKISHQTIKEWLINPQRIWLEQFEIKPKDRNICLEDVDALDLNELQRYQLLNERIDEYKNCLVDKSNISTFNNSKEYWEIVTRGTGLLPSKSAAIIEIELLEKRWQSLLKHINDLGHISIKTILFEDQLHESLWGDHSQIIIETGKIKSGAIMNAWLKHLEFSSSGLDQKKTILIARKSITEFAKIFTWDPIKKEEAVLILNDLKALASQGFEECWPVPPESGWALALASGKTPETAYKIFEKSWSGEFTFSGENKNPIMQLCFGSKCNASMFLENEIFHKALSFLYTPIINSLTK